MAHVTKLNGRDRASELTVLYQSFFLKASKHADTRPHNLYVNNKHCK